MNILIKGMKMPIFEHQSWDICKGTDGKWYMVDNNAETSDGAWHEIIPIPPHGRLGDLDELYISLKKWLIQNRHSMTEATRVWIRGVLEGIAVAPTIIPAEEEWA